MKSELAEIAEKAENLREIDPSVSLQLFLDSLKLAKEQNNQLEVIEILFNAGVASHNLSNHRAAKEYFTEALGNPEINKDMFLKANILRCLGVQFVCTNMLQEAIDYLYQSEKVSLECGYDENIHMIESTMGSVYIQLKMFDKALEHELKSLKIAEKLESGSMKSYSYLGIGSCYYLLNKLDDAEKFLLMVFGNETSEFTKANTYYYLSKLNFDRGNFPEAMRSAENGFEIAKANHIQDYTALCLAMKGNIYLSEGNYGAALKDLEAAISLAETFENKRIFFKLYKSLIKLYDKTGDYRNKAEAYSKLYEYHVEYLENQSKLKIKQLNSEHQVEKAKDEAEIERLKNVELRKALDKVNRLNGELAELNSEKNEFMAVAVHDLKNPLQNILSTARMIKRSNPGTENTEFAENIIQQTDRMFNLISKLLSHNAVEEGKIRISKSEFKADSICRDLINDYREAAARKQVDLKFENGCNGHKLFTDYDILFEIMGNIVSNAVKFSPQNTRVLLRTFTEGGNILFEVTDEGPGFNEEDKLRLFRKFSKLSARPTMGESSTGLGLSIVKKLCRLIDADIVLESKPGKGSSFRVKVG
ncbi:MAG: hypothetical protein IAE90_02715 [Ignavibacteria bacterium]|nr:hypothetical protein [Ignavibacteria bacterium]